MRWNCTVPKVPTSAFDAWYFCKAIHAFVDEPKLPLE